MDKSQQQHVVANHHWLEKGKSVWVTSMPQYPNPNEDAFLQGKVVEHTDKQAVIDLIETMKRVTVPLSKILKLTYGDQDVPDMVDLEQLNEPELLYNTKRRYLNDNIFTYCGPTLVIVNPYATIQKAFNEITLQEYQVMVFTNNLEYKSLSPHIFALAAFCLWQLFDNQRNQSIVISGESGAGKTENTKYCLKFLASLGKNIKQIFASNPSNPQRSSFDLGLSGNTKTPIKINYQNIRTAQKAIKKTSSKIFGIEQKILGCNEVLQAFGNSKTIRNDNSSRFGKLILLVYGETQIDIRSAFIISYLLEKSRIVSVSDGQRNYHIFYYFLKGTTAQQKQKYLLKQPIDKYYYLNQSTIYDIPKKSDSQQFENIKKQFQMYLTSSQKQCIYQILSIVLNIGNVNFKKQIEPKSNEEIARVVNQEYVKNVAQLLEVDYEKFLYAFSWKSRKLGKNLIHSPLRYDEAVALRDSFAKNIYQKCFNFLVMKLNQKIQIQKINFQGSQRTQRRSIGLLDIFGFQVLKINSLQQFFINFANQKLQQLYVSYIFKQQQNQFLKQGLKQFAHDIGFQDNKPIIDLIELYPLGIFHLLNQSSQLNKPDTDLPDVIVKNHNRNNAITIPKSKRGVFQINHSCSPVSYTTIGFTSKNKDQFPKQLLQIISEGKNQSMKSIVIGKVQEKQQNPKGKKTSKFLGSKFLSEMNMLTEQLYSCDCHFVRCIKPNSKKSPKLFNSEAVLQSLRYLGVLDSIKIRKLGYIFRRPYKQFYRKFYEIENYIYSYSESIKGKSEDDFKEYSRKMVEKYVKADFDKKNILFGSKKILIKESALNQLELLVKEKRRERIKVANRIKIMYKNSKFRQAVRKLFSEIDVLKTYMLATVISVRSNLLKKKIFRIQKTVRKYLWQKRYEKNKEVMNMAARKIISFLKMKKVRKAFLKSLKRVKSIQSNVRTYMFNKRIEKQKLCYSLISKYIDNAWMIILNKKASLIQRTWKGYRVREVFQDVIKKIKIKAFIKRAILKFRVRCFQQMLARYKKPIIMLQGIVRTRKMRQVFVKTRKSALIIQKAYRRHLKKRFYLQRSWNKYRQNLQQVQNFKIRELKRFGLTLHSKENEKKLSINQTTGIQLKLTPYDLMMKYGDRDVEERQDLRINQSIYFADKNTMQLFIADFDIISPLSYKGQWSEKYGDLKAEIARRGEYPLKLNISQKLTCVISNRNRIYSFGGQEEDVEGPTSKIQIKGNPQVLCINGQSGYLLNKQFQLYQWGDNKNYQLFTNSSKHFIPFNSPSQLINITDIEVKGSKKFYVDYQKKVFQKKQDKIQPLYFQGKIEISQIVSSYNFTHFLTTDGKLFSMGENSKGELGLWYNDEKYINSPCVNQFFTSKKQMIESVSVGLSHTVARSKLGYIYAWGCNKFGQVNSDLKIDRVLVPTLIEIEKLKTKCLQCVAGLRCSYILLNDFRIIALGTSSCLSMEKNATFYEVNLLHSTNMNSKNLIPIKISCTWDRQISVLTVNCLEINKCKAGTKQDVIFKYCKMMAKQWHQKIVYPPYSQWMDNILNLSDMRKFKFQKSVKPKNVNSNKNVIDSDLEELKLLMDLRKTSTLFKTAARKKIQTVMKSLALKPVEKWDHEEMQLNKFIKEQCQIVMK